MAKENFAGSQYWQSGKEAGTSLLPPSSGACVSVNYLEKFIDGVAIELSTGQDMGETPSRGKGVDGVHPAADQASLDLWDKCSNANRLELRTEPEELVRSSEAASA